MSKVHSPKKIGECIYCGAQGLLTADHVPPRSFYPSIPPDNLITVPSCRECNPRFTQDDEYARLVLTIDVRTKVNSDRNKIIPAVTRFANRKGSQKLLNSFHSSRGAAYLENSKGIYVWTEHFTVEGPRLDRFAQRITKALFYREKGHRLSGNYIVNAIHYTKFAKLADQSEDNRDFLEFIVTELSEQRQRKAWGGVFGYSWVQSPNDDEQTWWLLDFYGGRHYLCNTCNQTDH